MKKLWMCWFGLVVASWAGVVWAVPGPDSVAVIANKNVKESVALAQSYAKARAIPAKQVCLLALPNKEDISYADYQKLLLKPFEACLKKGGVTGRIESVLLIRGLPLRVSVPGGRASLAAVLGMWKSTDKDGKPAVGLPVGYKTKFLQAGWRNTFTRGVFKAGWSGRGFYNYGTSAKRISGQFTHKPLLVTMLHGRSYKDAALLLKSAIDAEKQGGAKGQFLLMNGRDRARGVLDRGYDRLLTELKRRGFKDSVREKFNTNLTGRKLAAFFTGTATLAKTIEGNSYLPGCLTDNLTSFGAVPTNFRTKGQSQVSIARWVAKGVAGAHGTTDEPLNNVFPSRNLLLDYVDGSTLAEAYFRRMPYVYWRNLVLGDPMLAPYAKRPKVTITGVKAGASIGGARQVTVTAVDPEKRGIASLALFVNGKQVAAAKTGRLSACVVFPKQGDVQVLAVAQAAAPPTLLSLRKFQPKGWRSLFVKGQAGGPASCQKPEPRVEPRPEPRAEAIREPVIETVAEVPQEIAAEAVPEPRTESGSADAGLSPDTGTQRDEMTLPEPKVDAAVPEQVQRETAVKPEPQPLSEGEATEPPDAGGCACDAGSQRGFPLWWGCVLWLCIAVGRRRGLFVGRR